MYSHLQGEGKLTQTAQLAATSPTPGCVWTRVAFSEDAKLHTQLILSRQVDRYGNKSLSSSKTNNNTGRDRRSVSLIFFPTSGKAGRTKKKRKSNAPYCTIHADLFAKIF